MNRPRTITVAVVLGGSVLLAACGSDDDPTAAAGPPTAEESGSGGHDSEGHDDAPSAVAAGARQIDVIADDFAFDPTEITAEPGEDLAIELTSEDVLHDFTIDELDAHVAADRGETATGGFSAAEAGTYTYYCSVPGHREAGMEGTLTVQ